MKVLRRFMAPWPLAIAMTTIAAATTLGAPAGGAPITPGTPPASDPTTTLAQTGVPGPATISAPPGPATISAPPGPSTSVASPPATTTTTTIAGQASVTSSTAIPAATTTTTIRSVRLDTADSAYLAGVNAQLRSAEDSLAVAQVTQRTAEAVAATKAAAQDRAVRATAGFSALEQVAFAHVRAAHDHLRDLAVSRYVSGGAASPINALLGAQSASEFSQREELVSALAKADGQALRLYTTARQQATSNALRALDVLEQAQVDHHQADAAVADAITLVAQRTAALSNTAQLLVLVSAAVDYPGTDIPRLVLDAYRRAAAKVQQEGCRLTWSALAAIGAVESGHGRSHGAQLTITGDLVPRILGPALDGQGGTALVLDTDQGRLDGDPAYDHAVGPMQFIPSTWAVVGRDGNGDGVADPNNIYDAALGAAAYLCRAAPAEQLDGDDALRQAFFSYNHSDAYAAEVLALSHVYAAVSLTS